MLYIRGYGATRHPLLWIPASEYVEQSLESFMNTPKNPNNTPIHISIDAVDEENGKFETEIYKGPFDVYIMNCGNDTYQLRYT